MGNHMRFNKPEVSSSEEDKGKWNDIVDDDGMFCSDGEEADICICLVSVSIAGIFNLQPECFLHFCLSSITLWDN